MFEPRGHADMYGCVLLPLKMMIMILASYLSIMKAIQYVRARAIIAISKLAVEMSWVKTPIHRLNLKLMLLVAITSRVNSDGKATDTEFHCVPSFVVGLDFEVEVEGLEVNYDLVCI